MKSKKNCDENITKCRNSLFAMLGSVYAYKCLLSPTTQLHIWRTCNLPILTSGLQALPIRPSQMKSLELFQRKVLRSFLKLSQSSPVPSIYFLLGELPVEGLLHIRTLGLFHNLWVNSDLTIHMMAKHILQMVDETSTTWCNHVNLLCKKYGLPPPLSLLQQAPWPKQVWKELVWTRVTAWHERKLRSESLTNPKMTYLNVQLLGLSGKVHPTVHHISNTQEVRKFRSHMKLLTCDFRQDPKNPSLCHLCGNVPLTSQHLLLTCKVTADVTERMMPDLLNTVAQVSPSSRLLQYVPPP